MTLESTRFTGARRDAGVLWLFRLTILVAAFLLFFIQPMQARRLLPVLGGTPAVWNTVMVFFQTALLIGYAYAHWISTRFNARRAFLLHVTLLILAIALPTARPLQSGPDGSAAMSILWILQTLTIDVGPMFILISATSPLLQDWFSRIRHSRSDNPYFLYAASNLGSFASLLCYPLIIERSFSMADQGVFWKASSLVLVGGISACGISLWTRRGERSTLAANEQPDAPEAALNEQPTAVTWRRRLSWLTTAAVASSWLLAITHYITTDLAPVPLLWIVPLSIYLLSFVLAFSQRPLVTDRFWRTVLPGAMVLLAASLLFTGTWQLLVLHLVAYTIGVMVCHYQLARRRPSAAKLTEFYFVLSLGGVVGGVFNAIVSPLLFDVILEYGLTVVAAGLVLASKDGGQPTGNETSLRDPRSVVTMLVTVGILLLMSQTLFFAGTPTVAYAVLIAVPIMAAAWLLAMQRLVIVTAGLLLMLGQWQPPFAGKTLRVERSFFGVHRVLEAPRQREVRLLHGATVHGIQSRDNPGDPLAYYARVGPLGEVFSTFPASRTQRVGVIGLGGGAVAAYAGDTTPPRQMTFFEIDPTVVMLASDPNVMTYLSDAGIEADDIVIGDGRTRLDPSIHQFDLLLLDAFSSDAVPMHLLTKEAMAVYRGCLDRQGLLVFHISNRHLDLGPVLAGLAADAGWIAVRCNSQPTADEAERGIAAADYVVMASSISMLDPLLQPDARQPVQGQRNQQRRNQWRRIDDGRSVLWTDDFSNFLDVVRWDWSLR